MTLETKVKSFFLIREDKSRQDILYITMQKLSRRRKKSRQGIAIKTGGHYSTDLIKSINNRVDQITNARLAPPIPSLTTDQLLISLNTKIQSTCTKSSDQLRRLQRIFGGGTSYWCLIYAYELPPSCSLVLFRPFFRNPWPFSQRAEK